MMTPYALCSLSKDDILEIGQSFTSADKQSIKSGVKLERHEFYLLIQTSKSPTPDCNSVKQSPNMRRETL
jgi:hypothetical protein